MGVDVWVVEACDPAGKTLWREIFDSAMEAERCQRNAVKQGLRVHCWNMMSGEKK